MEKCITSNGQTRRRKVAAVGMPAWWIVHLFDEGESDKEPTLGVVSAMHQLITMTGFFRQHSLTYRGVGGDTRQADIKGIALRPGGCTIAAFRDGYPDHSLMKLLIVPATLFRDHPRPVAGIAREPPQARP